MIFYLNRSLILEQEIVKALRAYFAACDVSEHYKNFTVNITNQHPFARLLLDGLNGAAPDLSLFPAVIVSTDDESDVPGLEQLKDNQFVTLEPTDIPLLKGHYTITDAKVAALDAAMNAAGGKLYGFSTGLRRHENLSVEIWAENVQLKNELYELTRLFIGGSMNDYFTKLYEDYAFAMFDDTLRGERSNNYNMDFGVTLAGARLTFGADYFLEQTVIDTELKDENIDFLEVINHIKGVDYGTTRSTIGIK
jgi:hypothetical protein